ATYLLSLDEAGEERLDGIHGPVRVELRHDDVAAGLLGAVPGPVPGDEDGVLVLGREHIAGVEAHAERRGVRTEEGCRRLELAAAMAPAELRVAEVALVAERIAEVLLAGRRDAVELV